MAEADAEDRHLAEQLRDRLVRARHRGRVARAVGEEHAVGAAARGSPRRWCRAGTTVTRQPTSTRRRSMVLLERRSRARRRRSALRRRPLGSPVSTVWTSAREAGTTPSSDRRAPRSSPSMPAALRRAARPELGVDVTARSRARRICAPCVRRCRTSCAGVDALDARRRCRCCRYASSAPVDRQFDGSAAARARRSPTACGCADSSSSLALVPTLPICGYVMVTICPTYEGSVRISW